MLIGNSTAVISGGVRKEAAGARYKKREAERGREDGRHSGEIYRYIEPTIIST